MRTTISIALLASLASVSAQAVTAIISAPGSTPSGCVSSESGVFGIQVVKAAAAAKKRQVTQIGDGQVQASSATPVTAISDGQVQAPKGATPVTAISDGQVQAPKAATPVTAISDGQVQAPAGPVTVTVTKNNCVASPVTQINDGQIQAPMATPVTQIGDGQIQNPANPVTQIGDGQIQNPATPVTQIGDGQIQNPGNVATPVTALSDGQPQAPGNVATATPVTAISDGQPQAGTATPVTALSDGQPQAATTLATVVKGSSSSSSSAAGGYAVLSGSPQTCASVTGLLKLTLSNGVLKDAQGRIGYIASNSQFQFDGPPQAGAIYTAGWSVCGDGLLALGSTKTFYQCLSGGFYNLYFQNILSAGQCEPINIEAIQINNC